MSNGWDFLRYFNPSLEYSEAQKRQRLQGFEKDPLLCCLEYSLFLGFKIHERVTILEESGKPVTCCRCQMILGRRGDEGLGHDEQSGCVKYWDISYADTERIVSKRACRFDDCRTTLQLDFVSIANPRDSDADRSPQHGRLTGKDFWAHGSLIFDVGRLSKKASLANWFDSSSPGSRLATMVAYNTKRDQFSKLTPPRTGAHEG